MCFGKGANIVLCCFDGPKSNKEKKERNGPVCGKCATEAVFSLERH